MIKLNETSIEWALLHLTRYHDSDFFPRLFEFEAIKNDWANIKKHLLEIDLEHYAPKSPIVYLAPKVNSNFRVVHQLDPIDSLILTAIIFEDSSKIEAFRILESRHIACSYRIKPDTDGSFFEKDSTGYIDFIKKAQELSDEFIEGFALVCDITDFYNQIYLHRVNNIYEESGSSMGQILEDFLTGLNTNISKGIPVGPAASTIIAEAIMADIDKKIITYTDNFTRYVDDIYIFFEKEEIAKTVLHDLTKYLYSNHRLVFASDKTKIIKMPAFRASYLNNEDVMEKSALHGKLAELVAGAYTSVDEIEFEDLEEDDKFKLRSETYKELFEKALEFEKVDIGLMRHILRQAGRYKIRSIIPLIFPNFNTILSVIREIVVYFNRVLTDTFVKRFFITLSG